MSSNFVENANKGVQALHPYIPGKPTSELQRELGLETVVKLASNENPLGCSPLVKKALQEGFAELALYPDGNGFELKTALSERLSLSAFGFNSSNLILGNGSNDVLELVGRAFLNPESEAVFSQHAFAVYPIVVQACGAIARVAKANEWGHDLDLMLSLVNEKTKVVFIANPNNPTGTWLKEDDLVTFLNEVPANVLVVLDEAYFEYVEEAEYPNGLSLLSRFSNLLVTRTFSKAYGLASLRVGYGIASDVIVDVLNRVRQPFNVNSFALAAAKAALADQNFIAESIKCNREGLKQLEQGFERLALDFIPSVGNFICVNFASVSDRLSVNDINDLLLKKGVIVRPVAVYEMPSYLRITVGTKLENDTVLAALASILS